MKATTIKLDGQLLNDIEATKPATQSVTAYVRDVVRKDIERRQLREAAETYQAFIKDSPEEAQSLREWGEADLASAPHAPNAKDASDT